MLKKFVSENCFNFQKYQTSLANIFYQKLEPKLKVLRRGKVDEALIKEELDYYEDELIEEAYSR